MQSRRKEMKKTSSKLFVVPYMLWIALFVLAPLVLIFGQSFFNIEGQFSLENYKSYFASQNLTYLKMSFNSVLYAGIVTFVTLLISYPTALFFDPSQAPSTLAHADYPAYLDQFCSLKPMPLSGIFWSKWLY